MKFLDVFSGIGGFRMGLEQAGHTCIGHIEVNEYARQAYEAIYDIKDHEFDGKDVTEIDDFGKLAGKYDILAGGFPCQSFSIAGHRRGFDDTRGTMFFHLARILEQTKPPLCLFENVKGLLSHDKGRTFETVLSTMDELGYDVEWEMLNSKDFGVPQNRERVYIVGHLRGRRTRKVFSNSGTTSKANDIEYTTTVPTKYRVAGGETYIASKQEILKVGGGESQGNRVYSAEGLAVTQTAASGGFGGKTGLYVIDERARKLTPRECWRLQGFPDWAFDRAKATGLSDTQLYKQGGNAVTVNVVKWIGERIWVEK